LNAPFIARVLRSYQSRAATWLYERDAAFLIAPLGAGKGAAALTAAAELIRDEHRRHALVIAPKLVAETVWPQEVAAWAHLRHLRAAVLNGKAERRRALLAAAAERQLTVIGVDLVPWLVSELAAFADDHPLFDILVVDETISCRRIAFASSARASSASTQISSCVVIRIGICARAGLVSIRVTGRRRASVAADRSAGGPTAVP
jgi:hypothetical protein